MAAVLVEGRGLTRRAEHLAALGTGPLEVLVGHSAPHRLAQRGDRRFSLAHQAVCSIRCLTGLLDELPGGVARLPRPLTHLLGQHRATGEMAAHTLGQIHTTARAEVGAVTKKLGAEFLMPEVLGPGGTLRRRVPPAVPEQEGTLLG